MLWFSPGLCRNQKKLSLFRNVVTLKHVADITLGHHGRTKSSQKLSRPFRPDFASKNITDTCEREMNDCGDVFLNKSLSF